MTSTPWGLAPTLATVAFSALVLAPPAAADPLPPRGSTACWDAIAAAPGVSEARAAASAARDEVEKTGPALYRAKTEADEAHAALARLSPGDAGYEAAQTRAADADTQYQQATTAQVSAQQDLEDARAEDDRLVLAAQDRLCAPTSTGDDGSPATISGSQVTEVPEGAARTGPV